MAEDRVVLEVTLDEQKKAGGEAPIPQKPPPVSPGEPITAGEAPKKPPGSFGGLIQDDTVEGLVDSILGKGGLANMLPSLANTAATQATKSPLLGTAAGTVATNLMGGLGGAGGAAGAGGMAGMLGGFGPWAIAGAAALVASQINNALTEKFDSFITGAAERIFTTRRADPATTALGLAAGASEFADPLQMLTGINLNPLDDAFRSLTRAVTSAIQGLDEMAKEMADFSPDVAVAEAEQEFRRFETEMLRARELGLEMARFVRARGEAAEQVEELKIALVKMFLPLITNIAENVNFALKIADDAREVAAKMGIDKHSAASVAKKTASGFADFLRVPEVAQSMAGMLFDIVTMKRKEVHKLDDKEANDIMKEIDKFLDPENFAQQVIEDPQFFVGGPGAGGP